MLKKVYYLVVRSGRIYSELDNIEFDHFPTEEEIITAIKRVGGVSVHIEERYKLIEKE